MTPQEFAAAAGVSRETLARLEKYDALLLDWSARMNLVARATLPDRWRRHFLDSAQLFPLIPAGATTLADLGSGAGFPGLVLAAMGEERGLHVTLVEATRKKAAFLSAAAEAMRLKNVSVIPERLESITISPPDVIVARAFARLEKLLAYAREIAGEKTVCFFLKGQDIEVELTETAKSWHIEATNYPSATSAGSTILAVRQFAPLRPPLVPSR